MIQMIEPHNIRGVTIHAPQKGIVYLKESTTLADGGVVSAFMGWCLLSPLGCWVRGNDRAVFVDKSAIHIIDTFDKWPEHVASHVEQIANADTPDAYVVNESDVERARR